MEAIQNHRSIDLKERKKISLSVIDERVMFKYFISMINNREIEEKE